MSEHPQKGMVQEFFSDEKPGGEPSSKYDEMFDDDEDLDALEEEIISHEEVPEDEFEELEENEGEFETEGEEEEASSEGIEEEGSREADDPRVDQLRETVERQGQRIQELMEMIRQREEEKAKEPESLEPMSLDEIELDDRTFDEIMTSKESFMDWFGKAAAYLTSRAAEEATRKAVSTTSQTLRRETQMRKLVSDFYEKHPALKEKPGRQKYLGGKVREIMDKEPDLSPEDAFEKAAEATYEELGIEKKAAKTDSKARKNGSSRSRSKKPPRFAKSQRGGKRAAKEYEEDEDSKTEKEKVQDLISTFDR